MFLKRLERRKGRKKHTYWALVESYRTGKGSRHRVVAYLGELSKREKNGWEQLGRRLNGKGQPPAMHRARSSKSLPRSRAVTWLYRPRWPTGASERYDYDASLHRMMLKKFCSTGWALNFPND